MSSIIPDSASAVIPAPEYDYDHAFRLIDRIKRALADPTYFAAAVMVYREMYSAEMAEKFTAAVEEQREYAALEAELAGGAA